MDAMMVVMKVSLMDLMMVLMMVELMVLVKVLIVYFQLQKRKEKIQDLLQK
jgi:hypothetical protein